MSTGHGGPALSAVQGQILRYRAIASRALARTALA
jgi:hypothetical protein